jgi:hypothetical protein
VRVLSAAGARYSEELAYLPVVRLDLGEVALRSFETLELQLGILSEEEQQILRERGVPGREPFRTVQVQMGGKPRAFLDLLPLVYDSAAGAYLKIISFCLLLDTEKRAYPADAARRHGDPYNSVLRDGPWYRLSVLKNGVYRIDYQFLRRMGIDPVQVDPRTIRIYGNGGRMLPQANSAPRPRDLTENAIRVDGEADGRFDPDDRILFYGQNPDDRYYDAEGNFHYVNNIYSDSTHYFLTFGGPPGLRVESRPDAGTDYPQVDSYDHAEVYERDIHNLLASGREWYGERYDGTQNRDFNFLIPGVLGTGTVTIRSAVMASSFSPVSFDLSLNGVAVGTQEVDAVPQGTYSQRGWDVLDTFTVPADRVYDAQGRYRFSLKYNAASGVRSIGYLNYFVLEMKRRLQMDAGVPLFFRSVEASRQAISDFVVAGAAEVVAVWEVSDPLLPVQQLFGRQGDALRFAARSDSLPEFIAFRNADLAEPHYTGPVLAQNLAGEAVPDLLIVAHPAFLQEAARLADFRRSHDGLKVLTVSTQQVYNEFASGSPDPTAIRDYARYLYGRSPGGLKNLLLFGRGSFDYKDRQAFKYNFVPIYTSRNSLHPIRSYSSDDYYAFMDEEEGEWPETFDGDHGMDIGVGRLPVKTAEEARTVVDKLIRYATAPEATGTWRNEVYFVADDGDFNIHQNDVERLALLVDTLSPAFNVNKIYLDAYPHVQTGTGATVPGAREAIDRAFDDGCLVLNFTGHGSETRWTAETVLNLSSISALNNRHRMPLMVTATCEFGRHDNPNIISGAEYALLHEPGGAIGLVTTSRPVFSSTNYILNRAFYQEVFAFRDGTYQNMGEIFRKTKNNSLNGTVNRNFSLLGDPSMTLTYPDPGLRIVEADEYDVPGDTLKALNLVRIRGAVIDRTGNIESDFRGTLSATVFAPPRQVETYGDESPVMTFDVRDEALFRGQATVRNGEFEFEFVASRNIVSGLGRGKISLYALSDRDNRDLNGAEGGYYVGGAGNSAAPDADPPLISLFINDSSFRDGGISGPEPLLLARLTDESGVDLMGTGREQGIMLELDENNPINISKYYTGDVDSYRTGWVRYPLGELPEGDHRLQLWVWDVHGNGASASLEFRVIRGEALIIEDLVNIPNPFRESTEFWLEHNRAGDDLEMLVRIFSLGGEEVMRWQESLPASAGRVGGLVWEGQSVFGMRLNSGVYLLNITLRSLRDGAKYQATRKIVMIN